jgi:hypothetical protein
MDIRANYETYNKDAISNPVAFDILHVLSSGDGDKHLKFGYL